LSNYRHLQGFENLSGDNDMRITDSFHIDTLKQEDATSLSEMMVSNHSNFKRHFPITLFKSITFENCLKFIEEKEKQNQEKSNLPLGYDNLTSKIAGLIIIKEINWETKQGELVYYISTDYENRGWMFKAIELTSKYGVEA
jgi:ribosomal-protein-alanine N-acetyltransferase